jgi:two-component system NtrC family sensor kinase
LFVDALTAETEACTARDDTAAAPGVETGTSLRWLRVMVWCAGLIPALVFVAACWWGYAQAFEEARDTVLRADRVVLRHAESAFETAAALTQRALRAAKAPDAVLRAREEEIHRQLEDFVLGLPAVAALTVWDANGRAVASSQAWPVRADLSIATRAYFTEQRAQDKGLLITGQIDSLVDGEARIHASARRTMLDGSFGGVVVVSLKPEYFQNFYRSLAREEPGLATFSLFKADGALLARWPAPRDGSNRVPEGSPLLGSARAGAEQGLQFIRSSFDSERRLYSFHRVDEQPIYVTAGLSESAILANWYRFVTLLATVLLPITGGMIYISSVALRKTRRERAVLLQLRDENRRRAHAEQALVQAQKLEALAQLTGGVAHDFNNLLAIIRNNLHVHKRLHPQLGETAQLAAIAHAVSSGVRLTHQLLSFSREQALKPETLLLQQWLPATADLLRTTLGRAIELQIEVAAGTAPVRVDATELELALLNIAVNARDAMPEGGSLQIRVAEAASTLADGARLVAIRIRDTGEGMTPEVLEKVFEPFFTTKPAGKGSGLGLSQVYGLCTQAGGVATVESAAGRGTTVSLLLPVSHAPAASPPGAAAAPATALQGRILVVEDNDAQAAGLVALLHLAGLTAQVTGRAESALAMLVRGRQTFDLVLADIVTPGTINGIELARCLQQTHPALPVLLISGYAASVHEALAGRFKVLAKPTDPDELLLELQQALASARRSAPAPDPQPATS